MLSIRTRERNYQRLNLCSHNQKCRQQPRGGAPRFSALRGQQRQNRRRFSKSNEHRQRENKERPSIVNETRFTRCIPGDIAIPLACPWHIRKPTSSLSVSERNRQRREKKGEKRKSERGRSRERKKIKRGRTSGLEVVVVVVAAVGKGNNLHSEIAGCIRRRGEARGW